MATLEFKGVFCPVRASDASLREYDANPKAWPSLTKYNRLTGKPERLRVLLKADADKARARYRALSAKTSPTGKKLRNTCKALQGLSLLYGKASEQMNLARTLAARMYELKSVHFQGEKRVDPREYVPLLLEQVAHSKRVRTLLSKK